MNIRELTMISRAYGIKIEKVKPVVAYGNLHYITTVQGNFYLKNSLGRSKIEYILKNNTRRSSIHMPQKTKEGHLGVNILGNDYMLFEEAYENIREPGAVWWAKTLGQIHSMNVAIPMNDLVKGFFKNTVSYLEKAIPLLSKELQRRLEKIFPEELEIIGNRVLLHGDPLNSNVLTKDGRFVLIDLDSLGLGPKEYDIQRKLWEQSLQCKDTKDFKKYYDKLIDEYEKFTQTRLNNAFIKYYYALDFIRTVSWLGIVSEDETREDRIRQKKEFEKMKKVIENGLQEKILGEVL